MPKYQCSTCNKLFTQKCHFDYHINRKYKCQPNICDNNQFAPSSNQIAPSSNQIAPNNNQNAPNLTKKIQHDSTEMLPELHIVPINNMLNGTNHNQILNETQLKIPLTDNNNNKDHECNYCHKTFSRKNVLYKHQKKNCKVAMQDNKNKQDIFDKLVLLENKNKQLEEELKNKNKQTEEDIKKLRDEINIMQNVSISNNINSNNINNNNINNTININIVPHGKEDIGKIMDMLLKSAKRGLNSVCELTESMHFNPELPEFHNVYIPDIKNKHAMVFENEWKLRNIADVINNIHDVKSSIISENKDLFFDKLNPSEQRNYMKWYKISNDKNNEEYNAYITNSLDRIKLLLFNEKNMVIATRKKQKLLK